MRLFTALWPGTEATSHLDMAVRSVARDELAEATAGLRGFRLVPGQRWHVTLRFHGDDADDQRLTDRLNRRVPRLIREHPRPPRLRLATAGVFRGVLWIGVQSAADEDVATLRSLARAAGADPDGFHAHVTVGRWSRGRADRRLSDLLGGYEGPWWTVSDITLVASELGRNGPVYRTIHRVGWTSHTAGEQGIYQRY